jgi:hypothetical protein
MSSEKRRIAQFRRSRRAAAQSVKPRRKQRKADPAFSLQGL